MGLRLSEAKTKICHIDKGFDFLGFRIQRRRKTRHGEARGLHLPVEKGSRLDRRSGAHADPQIITSNARGPAAPAQSGAAGLKFPLPLRRVQGDLRLPRPVHLAPGGPVDPQTTQPHEVGRPPTPLPSRVATDRGRRDVVPAPDSDNQPLPLPGQQHRDTLGEQNANTHRVVPRPVLVESRMRGDTHVRFGEQAGKT